MPRKAILFSLLGTTTAIGGVSIAVLLWLVVLAPMKGEPTNRFQKTYRDDQYGYSFDYPRGADVVAGGHSYLPLTPFGQDEEIAPRQSLVRDGDTLLTFTVVNHMEEQQYIDLALDLLQHDFLLERHRKNPKEMDAATVHLETVGRTGLLIEAGVEGIGPPIVFFPLHGNDVLRVDIPPPPASLTERQDVLLFYDLAQDLIKTIDTAGLPTTHP